MAHSENLLFHIRKYLAILLVAPLLVVSTLFLLLGYGLHGYTIAVANEDRGFDMPMAGHLDIPETLLKALDAKAFSIRKVATKAEAQALYNSGQVRALLAFPAELTKNMMIKQDDPTYVLPDKISISIAGDNPIAKLFVLSTIARSSLAAMAESGGGPSADSLPLPIDVETLAAGFGGASTYMISTILGFISWLLTGIISLFAVLALRKEGHLAAPVSPGFGLVFVLAFSLVGSLLFVGLIAIVFAILGLALPAKLFVSALVIFLLLGAASGLGLAAGTNAASPEHARPAILYLVLPLFFGGFLLPVEVLPSWLQWLPYLFPPFYGLSAALAVEAGSDSLWVTASIGITALWSLAFLALGLRGLSMPRTNIVGGSHEIHN